MKSDSKTQNPNLSAQADDSSSIIMPAGFANSKNTSNFGHDVSNSGVYNESAGKDGPPRLNLKG